MAKDTYSIDAKVVAAGGSVQFVDYQFGEVMIEEDDHEAIESNWTEV